MFSLFRFGFYFVISFFILSIPINKRPLFDLLYKASAPHREKISEMGEETIKDGKTIGKKLFNNAPNLVDSVTNQQSVTKRSRAPAIPKSELTPLEEQYSEQEQAILKKIIQESK